MLLANIRVDAAEFGPRQVSCMMECSVPEHLPLAQKVWRKIILSFALRWGQPQDIVGHELCLREWEPEQDHFDNRGAVSSEHGVFHWSPRGGEPRAVAW